MRPHRPKRCSSVAGVAPASFYAQRLLHHLQKGSEKERERIPAEYRAKPEVSLLLSFTEAPSNRKEARRLTTADQTPKRCSGVAGVASGRAASFYAHRLLHLFCKGNTEATGVAEGERPVSRWLSLLHRYTFFCLIQSTSKHTAESIVLIDSCWAWSKDERYWPVSQRGEW